jgi:antagonist of KipI
LKITVIKQGFQDLVQDLGRDGYTHVGISPTGAADKVSMKIANLYLGNQINDAVLEITLFGGTYLFDMPTTICLSGSQFPTTIRGNEVPFNKPITIQKGEALSVGGSASGARCYLAVQNGFNVADLLNSRSTHLMSKSGGFRGRNLQKEDQLAFNEPEKKYFPRERKFPIDYNRSVIRATLGLQHSLFDKPTQALFFSKEYTVSHQSNRMGIRITGPKLHKRTSEDMITEGLPLGAVQVTGNGDSIITFVDHQTTGGYPKIANVIAADMHKVGQLRPGDVFTFELITMDKAETLYLVQEQLFKQ